ncbi:MAG: murein L,D-transpeptidase family protein [Akkermansia sp.]
MTPSQENENRENIALQRVKKSSKSWLIPKNIRIGNPIFIRIIKEDRILELWGQPDNQNTFNLIKQYHIAGMSGNLGPKQKEGDHQAPEGFYSVIPSALNPQSNYHLSFNIGYPNEYDRSLGRTGAFIMIHGSNVSVGCFAITDAGIEEVYTMVAQALKIGQPSVPVQIYPFIPTKTRLAREKESPHYHFWQKLAQAWDYTERTHLPVPVCFGKAKIINQSSAHSLEHLDDNLKEEAY